MSILKQSIISHTTDCACYRASIPPVGRLKNFLIDSGRSNNGETFTELRFLMQYSRGSTEIVFLRKIRKFT
jgi:hypothetical protein